LRPPTYHRKSARHVASAAQRAASERRSASIELDGLGCLARLRGRIPENGAPAQRSDAPSLGSDPRRITGGPSSAPRRALVTYHAVQWMVTRSSFPKQQLTGSFVDRIDSQLLFRHIVRVPAIRADPVFGFQQAAVCQVRVESRKPGTNHVFPRSFAPNHSGGQPPR